jgi:biopolymer transport protein ExbD
MAIDFKKPGEAEPDVLIDINTTPLIDVMLVLLIMLIITIPIQTHAVKLDMPVGDPPPQTVLPDVVALDVDFDGTVSWNGKTLSGRDELDRALLAAASLPLQPELHVRANKLVSYKFVAAVLASAQRLGVSKIGIIGNEQFLETGD